MLVWQARLVQLLLVFSLTPFRAQVLLLPLRERAVPVHSHAVRPQHRSSRLHAAAVGRQLRSVGARRPRRPLPRRLLPDRRIRGRHGTTSAPRSVGHSSVRSRRQPGQDGGTGPVAVLPRRPTRLGRTDRVMHSSARGGAHSTATLPPPSASHHKGACCITDRQALLRSSGAARGSSIHATHVGRPASVQIQATLNTHSHRSRLP